MKRTQIYLTDQEQDFLRKEADLLGISKAEFLRRILDEYIEKKNEKT